MSYLMQNSKRSRTAGRFISLVHKEIQKAFSLSGMKQNEVANKLGVDRSQVNKQLMGQTNLTLRSIADLAWAFDVDIGFTLGTPVSRVKRNYFVGTPEIETDLSEVSSDGIRKVTKSHTTKEPEYV